MSDSDPLRRYIEAGIALTQLTRSRAEAIVKELVKAGEVQREHAQDRVDELLDRSRKGTGDLAATVRNEIAEQLSSMGFVTKSDLAELEARLITRFGAAGDAEAPPAEPAGPQATAKKGAAKKDPAKKAAAGKAAPTAAVGKKAAPTKAAPNRAAAKTAPPGTAARTARAAKAAKASKAPRPGAGPGTGGG